MKSNDDNLYAATVSRAFGFWWGRKSKTESNVRASGPRKRLNRQAPTQNLWVLPGPLELR